MNDSDNSCVQVLWWIQEIILHIEIHNALYKKWMILSRVMFDFFNGFMAVFYL